MPRSRRGAPFGARSPRCAMALLRVACVGGGGHCRSVLAYMVNAPHLDVVGVLDGGRAVGEVVLKEDEGREVRVVGTDREPESFADLDGVVVTIGDNAIRKRVVERLKAFTGRDGKPLQFPSVVHPRAFVSPGVAIGPGMWRCSALAGQHAAAEVRLTPTTTSPHRHGCARRRLCRCRVARWLVLRYQQQVGCLSRLRHGGLQLRRTRCDFVWDRGARGGRDGCCGCHSQPTNQHRQGLPRRRRLCGRSFCT